MKKVIYNISGFDCANCASKAEQHIAKQEEVEYAHLDFAGNKLYITFKNESWDIDKLAAVIKEVESDPLDISIATDTPKKNTKLFTSKMWWQLIRVIISLVVTLICIFTLGKENLSWLRFSLYAATIVLIGYDIFYKVILHIKNRANILDNNLLILIATIGSLTLSIIGLTKGNFAEYLLKINDNYYLAFDESMEAVLVMVLFQIGSIVESVASNKSKMAITSAVELRVDTANLISEEGIKVVKPEELNVGDNIIVKAGELIPVDGTIYEGEGFVDTSSLTGEYVPIHAKENTLVFAGCLLKDGSIKVKVDKTYANSSVSKIINLITSGSEKKSRADEFVARFAKWYTPIIVGVAILTFIIGGFVTQNWSEWIHTALEILVIGCPCSIVISVPLAYFSGIGLASKYGIVIKGGNYLDELSRLSKVITDKTGTLTHGSFQIVKVEPINLNKEEFLDYLYAVESLSTHPIGKAICHDIEDIEKIAAEQEEFVERAGLGCYSIYKGHKIIVGNIKLLAENNINVEPVDETGTVVYLAIDNEYAGYVVLDDQVKEEAKELVNLLHKDKVEVVLLTGDHQNNAKAIADELGIDRYYAELLPEDKTTILEKEMENAKENVAFIGDGINDAPSIKRSDIGIAMGAIGSDIAVENADVVIMNDNPKKLYEGIKISKKTRNTAIFNIVFALVVKFAVAILAIVFPSWNYMMYIAVFADTGLTVLLVINSLLLLHRKVK